MAETTQTFTTVLLAAGGNNVGIVVPDDVVAAFDRGRRVPVVVTIDGDHTYRGSVVSMGGRFLVSFSAAQRAATGRGAGDSVEVRLEVDDASRDVAPPPELQVALDEVPGGVEAWTALSPSRQRAHAESVTSAKTDETRARRIAKVVAELSS